MTLNKRLLLIIAIVCAVLVLVLALNLANMPSSQVQNNGDPLTSPEASAETPDIPDESLFVVPEVPLGVLGSLGALAAAFGIFTLKKRNSNKIDS